MAVTGSDEAAAMAERRLAEIRLLLVAILAVSIVGVIFLAWDALD
jgi:hypothetical protein